MKIIKASLAFCDILAELHKDGFDAPWATDAFKSALLTPGTFALIANDDLDEPLGFVLLRMAGDEAEILTILTQRRARRSGVARAIMGEAIAQCERQNMQKIFLEVATDNPAANTLYLSLDFQQVGRRKAYYARNKGPRVDAVVMEKCL